MSIYLSEEDQDKNKREVLTNNFPTHFKCMQSHCGPRNGELHGFLGTTGSGKSTLARALIVEFAKHGKIFIWASEETVKKYSIEFNLLTRDKQILNNIYIYSEKSLKTSYKKNIDCFFDQFEERILTYNPKLIFIDNITTSLIYDGTFGFEGQSRSTERLTRFAQITNVPIMYIAHTRKGVSDNQKLPIELEDIRGNAQIINTSSYAYVLQRFKKGEKFYPCLHVKKHRYHEISCQTYLLDYENRTFVRDYPLTWEQYNEIFKSRNVLG